MGEVAQKSSVADCLRILGQCHDIVLYTYKALSWGRAYWVPGVYIRFRRYSYKNRCLLLCGT